MRCIPALCTIAGMTAYSGPTSSMAATSTEETTVLWSPARMLMGLIAATTARTEKTSTAIGTSSRGIAPR